eukprot:426080_1
MDDKDLQLSPEETKKFSEAMKKKDFRDMFMNYVEELSDPKVKAENEKYLRQLEAEGKAPKNRKLMQPSPVFCVKTKTTKTGDKVFINVCSGDLVDEAKVSNDPGPSDKHSSGSHGGNLHWRVPYILSECRPFKANDGSCFSAFDIVFNTKTIKHGDSDKRFKTLIIQTALEAVESKSNSALVKQFKTLKNFTFKGGEPPLMSVNVSPDAKLAEHRTPGSSRSQKQSTEQKNPRSTNKKSCSPEAVPEFEIVYSGEISVQNFTTDRVQRVDERRPELLIVRVKLPKLTSIKGVVLDISEKQLQLCKPKMYRLSVDLPYAVDEAGGSAKFDKGTRELRVSLPVKHATADESAEFEKMRHTINGKNDPKLNQRNVDVVEKKPNSNEKLSSRQNVECDTVQNISNALEGVSLDCENDTSGINSDIAVDSESSGKKKKYKDNSISKNQKSLKSKNPRVVFRQTPEKIILMFKVSNIQSSSVTKNLTNSMLSLSFSTFTPHVCYQRQFVFPHPVNSEKCSVDVTTRNMILQLEKVERMDWDSFEVKPGKEYGTEKSKTRKDDKSQKKESKIKKSN